MPEKPAARPEKRTLPPAAKRRVPPAAKRGVQSKRVTPKGGAVTSSTAQSAHRSGESATASTRYTPPIPKAHKVSPWWVPALMFAFLGIGALLIVLNYAGVLGDVSNVKLVIGLGFILAGIITATQYH
jgi:hypothetical protein